MKTGTAILGRGLERFVFRPWGISGGGPGSLCRVILNKGLETERELGKIDMFVAEKNDLITILTAGGGGFGDPFTRPVDAVLRDVKAGFVSKKAAFRDYGVVINGGNLDLPQTTVIRSEKSNEKTFGFGPERIAWEKVFDDKRMCNLSEKLLKLPATIRAQNRKSIMERIVPDLNKIKDKGVIFAIKKVNKMRKALDNEIDKLC